MESGNMDMNARGFFSSLFDLSFQEFITTKIIKVLYVIAIIGSAIGALAILVGAFASRSFFGIVGGLISASIGFCLFVILARVWMEVLIVLFRIAKNTGKIASRGEQPPQA